VVRLNISSSKIDLNDGLILDSTASSFDSLFTDICL